MTASRGWTEWAWNAGRLARLANWFTAAADIVMGAWIASGGEFQGSELTLLVVASIALYGAGMVANDLADFAIDRIERPQRPLPAGQISRRAAANTTFGLTILGIAAAEFAGVASGIVALVLAVVIFGYNAFAKRTPLGPIVMGLCRSLNVVLAMSPWLGSGIPFWLASIPLGNGVYIAGVTFFSRRETTQSSPGKLTHAAAWMAAGLAIHAVGFLAAPAISPLAWPALAAFAAVLGMPVARAIRAPGPAAVQRAVKTAILGLVALDAVLALAHAGPVAGLAVLGLLAPAVLLGRWFPPT